MNKAQEERLKERNKQRALQRQEEPPSTLEDEDDWEINTYTKDYHIENIFNAHLCTYGDETIFDMRGLEACVDLEYQEAATFYWGSPTTMYVTYGSYIDGLNDLRKLRAYLLKEKVKVWVDDDTPIEAICDCFPLFFSGLEFYSLDE